MCVQKEVKSTSLFVCLTYVARILEVEISRFELELRALITGQTPSPAPIYDRYTVYVHVKNIYLGTEGGVQNCSKMLPIDLNTQ